MCVLLLAAAAPIGAAEEPRPRNSFTNDDLDRIAPRRGETGVLSTPALKPSEATKDKGSAKAGEERGESYWRSEADKVHSGLQRLRAQAEAARLRLEKARRNARDAGFEAARASAKSGASRDAGRNDVHLAELEADLRSLEQEIRSREQELEERARRAGALPGWIR
jgi:flagellar biosynthesis/type III secretory pathway protein FliH